MLTRWKEVVDCQKGGLKDVSREALGESSRVVLFLAAQDLDATKGGNSKLYNTLDHGYNARGECILTRADLGD